MERCERNAEVQVLRLDDCYNIFSDDVERLEEIVVDVIWDGLEQETSTEYDSEEGRDLNYGHLGFFFDEVASSSEGSW